MIRAPHRPAPRLAAVAAALALACGGCGDSYDVAELDGVTNEPDVSAPTGAPDISSPPDTATGCSSDEAPPDTPPCPPLPPAQPPDFWDLGPHPVVSDVECGVRDDGTYEGPCDLAMPEGRGSTLCDERTRRCFRPRADCADGWCRVPPASFVSGASADGEANMGPPRERPDAVIAVVTRGFFIQETEMTSGMFWDLLGYCPGRPTDCGPTCPVHGVSVYEAMRAANALSEREGLSTCYALEGCGPVEIDEFTSWTCDRATFSGPDCLGYRLPSWAEFELAARAGSPYCSAWGPVPRAPPIYCESSSPWFETSVSCANACVDYAGCVMSVKHDEPTCIGPLPAASLGANPFGLYDTTGNVAEYTHSQATRLNTDPAILPTGAPRIDPGHAEAVEGDDFPFQMGGWYTQDAAYHCAYYRWGINHNGPAIRGHNPGFRLVRTDPEPRAP